VGFGFGRIGWLALGPRDVFHPWFGAGHSFTVVNFNDLHNRGFVTPGGRAFGSNLERVMTDERMRNSIMHVSAQDFANGRMTRSAGPVSESMLRSASVMRGGLPVSPARANLGTRVGNTAGFRSGTANEHYFSRNTESPGRTANFGAGPASSNNWSRYATGNQSGRWPAAVNGGSYSGQRSAPATPGNQGSWRGFASRPAPSGGASGYGQSAPRGGWQGYSNPSRSYSSGASRPPLNLNRPIMRQRSEGTSSSGRSAPSGGRTYSEPHSSGGGGGTSHGSSGGSHDGGGKR